MAMPHPITSEEAQTLALKALAFLASEPERLEPFLAVTGLGPATLRSAAQEPGFLLGVLDHLCASDSLLLEFAGNLHLKPEMVAQARETLAGPPEAYEP
ncbi:Protein of unknown function [Bosea lupini]|jgi:hypothetical protein|uniref:DUF3572 domain-containing protein n=2 Tax=Boseaceae TaxID=2831100 RepID=A0A1H7YVA8_9HYPH|nr:Protein of unknown function [Bosea lupini]